MPPVGLEPTIPVGERPQTYSLDRVATGTRFLKLILLINLSHTVAIYEQHHALGSQIIAGVENKQWHKCEPFSRNTGIPHRTDKL
jgi:hypothetical protein